MTTGDAPPRSLGRARSAADWERVEADYRAGVKSIRQIGKEQGVSHTAIQKRADAEQWSRDLSGKIRAAADAALAREVAKAQVSTEVAKATERDIVAANAEVQVAIVREHRADIRRARSLSQRLMADLETVAGSRETLEDIAVEITREDKSAKRRDFLMRAVALPEHAGTLESLTRSLRHLVGMERQAFSIDDRTVGDRDEPQPLDRSALPHIDYAELRRRIQGKPEAPEY